MKKTLTFALIALAAITLISCGKAKSHTVEVIEPAPVPTLGMTQNNQIETPGSDGRFGEIRVNVDGEWVNIHGEEESYRSMRNCSEDDQDEEIRWGSFVDWIRRSN